MENYLNRLDKKYKKCLTSILRGGGGGGGLGLALKFGGKIWGKVIK